MIGLEDGLGDGTFERLYHRWLNDVEDPCWNGAVFALLSNPEQNLLLALELDTVLTGND